MNYFIFVLLLVGIQSLSPAMSRCVGAATQFEQKRIISNIRNKTPQNNNEKIREIFSDVLVCVTGSSMSNTIAKNDFYRVIYRIIFKNESDLTSIHKEYCNSGKDYGIKKCFSILGENYPCDKLMGSFGPCGNDYNYNDGL